MVKSNPKNNRIKQLKKNNDFEKNQEKNDNQSKKFEKYNKENEEENEQKLDLSIFETFILKSIINDKYDILIWLYDEDGRSLKDEYLKIVKKLVGDRYIFLDLDELYQKISEKKYFMYSNVFIRLSKPTENEKYIEIKNLRKIIDNGKYRLNITLLSDFNPITYFRESDLNWIQSNILLFNIIR